VVLEGRRGGGGCFIHRGARIYVIYNISERVKFLLKDKRNLIKYDDL